LSCRRLLIDKLSMKVLHLIDSGGLYGAEKMLLTLVKEQISQGLDPKIFSVGDPEVALKPIEREAQRLGLPVVTWRMKPGLNLAGMQKILEFADREGFTHLHSHGYKFNILLAVQRRSRLKQMTVATIHGYVKAKPFTRMWLYEITDRIILRRLDKIVLVNKMMAKESPFKSIPSSSVICIPNGLEISISQPAANEERQDVVAFFRKYPVSLVCVGRLSPEKGFDLALSAVESLSEKFPQLGLCIFGTGRLHAELADQAKRGGFSHRIYFAGYVENPAQYLRHCKALVLPSRTEGLPMTLLEAMLHKIPVIASSVGGIPEALEYGASGYLVKPGDKRQLADCIENLLRCGEGGASKTQRAFDRVINHYSSSAMARNYFEVYNSMSSLT